MNLRYKISQSIDIDEIGGKHQNPSDQESPNQSEPGDQTLSEIANKNLSYKSNLPPDSKIEDSLWKATVALVMKLQNKLGSMVITNNDPSIWSNIKDNLQLHKAKLGQDLVDKITVVPIVWDESLQISGNKYDYVCITDSNFSSEFSQTLIRTIPNILTQVDDQERVFLLGKTTCQTPQNVQEQGEELEEIFEEPKVEILGKQPLKKFKIFLHFYLLLILQFDGLMLFLVIRLVNLLSSSSQALVKLYKNLFSNS